MDRAAVPNPDKNTRTLRLIDGNGYTVAVRDVPEEQVQAVTAQLLDQEAVDHAAQWADFGYHPVEYRVV